MTTVPLKVATWLVVCATEMLARWRRNHRHQKLRLQTVARLRALDDRTLKDIGIERSEIESVVYDSSGERRRSMSGSEIQSCFPASPRAAVS
jgi:uncharacterized protein YjiS (DUF1127 family)